MKKITDSWLVFAQENLTSALVLLDSDLYNPCLQNIQQAIEKYLKGLVLEQGNTLKKTHSIRDLVVTLRSYDFLIDISEDEIDLIDSIYLPSKYPLASVIPDFCPDKNICLQCLDIAERIKSSVISILDKKTKSSART